MGGTGGVYIARWEASELDLFLYGFIGICLLIGLAAMAGLINSLALIVFT